MKAVILAGGLGTRLREETEFRPKPMVEIGGRPILWHIMKHVSRFGISDFVIAVGYKGEMIKDYFLNYETRSNDFTIRLGDQDSLTIHGRHDEADWNVTVVDTGLNTPTGGRLKRLTAFLSEGPFLVTYGDGLSDIDLHALLAEHRERRLLATLTLARPTSRFGIVELSADGQVSRFREKPQLEGWVNIGYFVFESEALSYLLDDAPLEHEPLRALASDGQLGSYEHRGYWQPMDTYKEAEMLNQVWNSGKPPWKSW